MKALTNCTNCGAVMEYSKQYYGGMYKCPYCNTEYHIDLLGRVEEYKVKFKWMGKLVDAYLSSVKCDYNTMDTTYLSDNQQITLVKSEPILTFEFISTSIDDAEDEEKIVSL